LLHASRNIALTSQQPIRIIGKEPRVMIASSNPECQLLHLYSPCEAL
jgi:hypothetical protein